MRCDGTRIPFGNSTIFKHIEFLKALKKCIQLRTEIRREKKNCRRGWMDVRSLKKKITENILREPNIRGTRALTVDSNQLVDGTQIQFCLCSFGRWRRRSRTHAHWSGELLAVARFEMRNMVQVFRGFLWWETITELLQPRNIKNDTDWSEMKAFFFLFFFYFYYEHPCVPPRAAPRLCTPSSQLLSSNIRHTTAQHIFTNTHFTLSTFISLANFILYNKS